MKCETYVIHLLYDIILQLELCQSVWNQKV